MVAPTRTPQARGVKCSLCKKILAQATWLDQTKLAKNVKDAELVLELIKSHNTTDCPCIPKSIENLLVGSTHFEIHRLINKRLDTVIHKKQYEHYVEVRQKALNEQSKKQNENINDCGESNIKTSRFKIYKSHHEQKDNDLKEQLRHLSKAIDFWKLALEDQANPFNSKLALRLGLTHHVIYACYLYKYYKIFDYQLIAANFLLNLFRSIEGVTTNAILHAYFILIKTLIDCDQLQTARHCLKQATKITNHQDKTHYETILLACVSCELNLLDGDDGYESLEELGKFVTIQADDKLQHYYARTLALTTIIKYIQCYPTRSELCFEFYHTFRYICAIIRRCYESSFELVLSEKDINRTQSKQLDTQTTQILDHSWIRYAVCDFAFTSFNLLSNFYLKSGQPEGLELLYNGLNLVSYRSGCCYWQIKMAAIGVNLDILCDKYDQAKLKVDVMSQIIGYVEDSHLMNLLRLDLEVSLLSLLERQETVIKKEVVIDLLQRIKCCYNSLSQRISTIELYDCKTNSYQKLHSSLVADTNLVIIGNNLGNLSLKVLKIGILSLLKASDVLGAQDLIMQLGNQLNSIRCNILEYYDLQTMLEIMLHFADINKSERLLLDSIGNNHLFLENENNLTFLESQISSLTINSEQSSKAGNTKRRFKAKPKFSQLSLRRSKRKGTYDVASESEENLYDGHALRLFDPIEAIKNFSTLSKEEIVVTYLRNSEPNPDYYLYRRAHELMYCFRMKDEHQNQEQLLYHFSESNTSNTMRYRWMMFEEQQVSPFEPVISTKKTLNCNLKHLGFSGVLVNQEKNLKSMTKIIPEESRLIQFKYIIEKDVRKEHLLVACFDNEHEPFYIHCEAPVTSDDFFKQPEESGDCLSLTLPNKILSKIEEAKKTLFFKNHRSRSEVRNQIEKDLGVLIHDIENDWFGPFRILFSGKVQDSKYGSFVKKMVTEFLKIMKDFSCNSNVALRFTIENAVFLSREEFCQLLATLFNCSTSSNEIRDCFNKWLKSLELHIANLAPGMNKMSYVSSLNRGQIGLILDKHLEHLPLESLPIARIIKQGIFRIPSLRLFSVITNKIGCSSTKVDATDTFYILDPANNLAKTRERFEIKLKACKSWLGSIGQAPKTEQLEQWLSEKQIYIFIGHGAGTTYYNKLCKNRGLNAMQTVRPVSVAMGCSSGRLTVEGPRLESFGIGWVFILRGAPAYVGLLWDVTDKDIDKFLESFLSIWMKSYWSHNVLNQENSTEPEQQTNSFITDAVSQARQVCQSIFLVGSTPIVYGIPVSC